MLSDERLAEIRRSVECDPPGPWANERRFAKDRADLLAEVDRLRARDRLEVKKLLDQLHERMQFHDSNGQPANGHVLDQIEKALQAV